MMCVSQTELAEIAGVSRSAISQAVKKGRLPATPEGLDLDEPEVTSYIARHTREPYDIAKELKVMCGAGADVEELAQTLADHIGVIVHRARQALLAELNRQAEAELFGNSTPVEFGEDLELWDDSADLSDIESLDLGDL